MKEGVNIILKCISGNDIFRMASSSRKICFEGPRHRTEGIGMTACLSLIVMQVHALHGGVQIKFVESAQNFWGGFMSCYAVHVSERAMQIESEGWC